MTPKHYCRLQAPSIATTNLQPLNPFSQSETLTPETIPDILGLPFFADISPTIVASSYERSFLTKDLSEHSLCKFKNVDTPDYSITHWAGDGDMLSYDGHELHIEILQTPGHTPDELAWYDMTARHLYVGDSFYERISGDKSYEQAIVFPKEGNLIHFMESMDKLIHYAQKKDAEEGKDPIKVGCGHITSSAAGVDILLSVKSFFLELLESNIPISSSVVKRGEQYHLWKASGNPRFSVEAPSRIVEDARKVR